ncbi:MAG: ECF transporter S component [Actinobacteria bacterium]|nr:ECF transporter S component [Actinomycetota bacterium]
MQTRSINKDDKVSKRTIVAALMILVCIPLAMYVGIVVFDDRNYYATSLVIILLAMIPFALVFEERKPQARELVIIAVLVAIAIAGRAAFFMLPQVKPVVAIVIIAGICLGGEAGFVVGAMTGFVSNFFFGQGPWTPWQMFAFGIIGFLAGVLFKKGMLPKRKVPLIIFGALTTFFIYGLLLDTASLLMYSQSVSWKALLTIYATGLPFNLVHAISTAFFLFVLSKPMMEKLDRIKKKYGLLEP